MKINYIVFQIIRFMLSYLLIYKTNLSLILKSLILFLPLGLDDVDSLYPHLLGFKRTKKFFNSDNEYIIMDKINDLLAYWMFFNYLNYNKILKENYISVLLILLLLRTYGTFLYFFKKNPLFKKLKVDKKIFFYIPDFFSKICIILLLDKKYNFGKKKLSIIIIITSILKIFNEYYLHVSELKNKIKNFPS